MTDFRIAKNSEIPFNAINVSTKGPNFAIPMQEEAFSLPIQKLREGEKLFIFDIDNTLYKQANGMHENIIELINAFAESVVKDRKLAEAKVGEYYMTYGVTIKGFLAEYPAQTDLSVWEQMYDHKLKIEEFVKPDLALREMLFKLKDSGARIYALTNSSENVGYRMLKSLKVVECFEGMLHCAYSKNQEFMCKPQEAVYEFIHNLFGICDPNNVYIFEDRELCLEIPIDRGWNSTLITVDNHIKKVLKNVLQNFNK